VMAYNVARTLGLAKERVDVPVAVPALA